MKKKFAFVMVCALALVLLAACTTVLPVAGATGTVGSKVGEAKQAFVFGFPLNGQGGIKAAAKNGGISKVGVVDVRIHWPASPIIPYWEVTTVVSGE
ncbi:hypothetical protein H0R92_03595 [Treponema sp. OMZ 840]|uniref:TRL domain-containing protein n=1 Tax=Treponema sp. OMZ 840 TaxID=244313 RepID=UPI003D924B8B